MLSLSLAKFLALPQVNQVKEFDCVEGWKVHQVPWEGVSVREIMSRADIKPEAKYIVFWSDDGLYSSALPVELALRPDVILAHKMDGKELPAEQGLAGPAGSAGQLRLQVREVGGARGGHGQAARGLLGEVRVSGRRYGQRKLSARLYLLVSPRHRR